MPKLKKYFLTIVRASRVFLLALPLNVYGQTTAIEKSYDVINSITPNEVIETKANTQLQTDITKILFTEASKSNKKCNHHVLKAEGYKDIERSIIISKMNRKAIELEQGLRAKNQILVERWFVRSCEAMNVYEVLLIKSGEGADIMVKKIEYKSNKK